MKSLMRILAVLAFIIIPLTCFAEDIYISQSSTGADTGANCLNAHSASWFNTSGNWGAGAGKISAGDTAHLCGTITTTLTAQGSGSAGSQITIYFESGAKLSQSYCDYGTGCFNTNSKTYLTIDGGTNGIIESTNQGTGKGNKTSTGIRADSCHNCEIKNLHIHDMYVRTSTSDTVGTDANQIHAITFSGINFSFHNNVIHDVGWAIKDVFADGDGNVSIYNNDISRCAHTVAISGESNRTFTGSFYYYGNYVHDFANWDIAGCGVAHTSALHAYGVTGGTFTGTLWVYNNRLLGDGTCMTGLIFLEGGSDSWTTGVAHTKIFNNYISAQAAPAGTWVTGLVQPSNSINEIYNNTIIGNGNSETSCINNGTPAINTKMKNNAIGNCGKLFYSYPSQTIDPGLEMDYNLYFSCSSYNCFWIGTTDTGSFSSYRSAQPSYDAHSLNSTASATGGLLNGIPQAGAPVINTGINLTSLGISALNSDINGQSRPITGPWCIGAYNPISSKLPLPPSILPIN